MAGRFTRVTTTLAAAILIGTVAGCSSGSRPAPPPGRSTPQPAPGSVPAPEAPEAVGPRRLPRPLPPPAEPAVAPPTSVTPVGQVLPVGAAPEGIVADPVTRTVTVGVRSPNQLVLFNADTGQVTGRVPLPGVLRHLQLAAPGGPVLVPDESSNSLLRVGLPAGQVLARVPTGVSPHDANQAPNGTIFVANEGGASVVAIRGDRVVHTFTDVTQPAGLAHIGDLVGLIDVRENTLTIYDSTALNPVSKIAAGTGPTHVVADIHGRFLVADTRGGAILVFEVTPQPRQVARAELPGQPYGITYDATRDRFWVTVTAANQLVGYDMSQPTPREVARFPTVRQPNTVTVDPVSGKLFVTGTADGTVEIITP
ncbi:MAG: YncE family protein [Pseudonocardia sp.]|nr:YncE family protein [Pseudonocardia sp.]